MPELKSPEGPSGDLHIAKKGSLAAERMRRHRDRHRRGFRSLPIEVHELDIQGLVRLGFLSSERSNDKHFIIQALYGLFDQTLVEST